MERRNLKRCARGAMVASFMTCVVLAPGVAGSAQAHWDHPRLPATFAGLLNDYTPPAPLVTNGPYEMHGKWSLHLNEERGSATFTAEMTMETAGFANTDLINHDPAKLGPHTHHLSVKDGVLHNDPADPTWKTQCPTFKPAVTDGFVVTGTAYVTGNGGNPPFGNPSAVVICILGGTLNPSLPTPQAYVEYSNFTLQFVSGSVATVHFGTQAINGVVAECDRPWRRESSDCRVAIAD